MSPNGSELVKIIVEIVSSAINGPKTILRCIAILTISMVETIWFLFTGEVIEDFRRIKEALLKKMEAEADSVVADVRLKNAKTKVYKAKAEKIREETKVIQKETKEIGNASVIKAIELMEDEPKANVLYLTDRITDEVALEMGRKDEGSERPFERQAETEAEKVFVRSPRTINFLECVLKGKTPVWGHSAALHGQLLDLDREYPPSPFAE